MKIFRVLNEFNWLVEKYRNSVHGVRFRAYDLDPHYAL